MKGFNFKSPPPTTLKNRRHWIMIMKIFTP